MSAENPLHEISGEDLLQELIDRGVLHADALGGAAVNGVLVDTETMAEQVYQAEIGNFMGDEAKIDAGEQLEIMGGFWRNLGYELPELTTNQAGAIADKIADHPDHRVIPTPLLSLSERKAIAEKARTLAPDQFSPHYDVLWVTDEDAGFSKLLKEPESVDTEGSKTYGLRYKTPGHKIVSRDVYVASLKEAGQAIEAEDGTIWTFPVMDVSVRTNRTAEKAKQFHDSIDSIASPESLIVTQLLQQVAGTPNTNWEVDFTNEAIYELNKDGSPKSLLRLAGIRLRPDRKRIVLDYWNSNEVRDNFGVRDTISGL